MLVCFFADNEEEMCFILEEDSNVAVEKITVMKEVLVGTECCKPKLDRSLKVSDLVRPDPRCMSSSN